MGPSLLRLSSLFLSLFPPEPVTQKKKKTSHPPHPPAPLLSGAACFAPLSAAPQSIEPRESTPVSIIDSISVTSKTKFPHVCEFRVASEPFIFAPQSSEDLNNWVNCFRKIKVRPPPPLLLSPPPGCFGSRSQTRKRANLAQNPITKAGLPLDTAYDSAMDSDVPVSKAANGSGLKIVYDGKARKRKIPRKNERSTDDTAKTTVNSDSSDEDRALLLQLDGGSPSRDLSKLTDDSEFEDGDGDGDESGSGDEVFVFKKQKRRSVRIGSDNTPSPTQNRRSRDLI